MRHFELAEKFMLTEAASGYEKKMAYLLREELEPLADSVRIDNAGNVVAKIDGVDPSAPTVMIMAHIDQLGFIIRKIEESGLIQVDRMGGIPEKVLPALDVSVATIDGGYLPGVIGVKSHHVTPAEEKYKVDVVTSLFIDIGASNKRQVLNAGVRVGCPVIYRPSFQRLMDSRVCGTAVDDRCGLVALVDLAARFRAERPRATTYLVGSVMEEFNIRGAIIAAREAKPDIALCLDIVMSGDTPDLAGKYDVKLGQGPTVTLYNFHGRGTLNGAIAHNGLYRLALSCAEKDGLRLQEFSSLGMLTETAYVQMEGRYIACLDMGFPARYTHSPVECCDMEDVKGLAAIVAAMVRRLDATFHCGRY